MKSIITIILIFLVLSCQTAEEKSNRQIIKQWTNKEVILPNTLKCKYVGQDTLCNHLFEKKYKILLYVDSVECTPCRLQLYEWHKKIKETKLYSDSLAFLLIVNTRNPKLIDILVQKNHFDYPIFFDKNGNMQKINHFPEDPYFQTFLLNQENKILLIGNPNNNKQLWELYKKIISGEIKDEKME